MRGFANCVPCHVSDSIIYYPNRLRFSVDFNLKSISISHKAAS
jgi:hypothetical protein